MHNVNNLIIFADIQYRLIISLFEQLMVNTYERQLSRVIKIPSVLLCEFSTISLIFSKHIFLTSSPSLLIIFSDFSSNANILES